MSELETQINQWLEAFLSHTKSWFHPRDLWNEYNIKSEEAKSILRRILEERVVDSVLEHEGQKYRIINRDLREIDWFEADESAYIKMSLPFGLERYLKLFPGIVIVAGEKGKGKSAWIMDCIFKNISSRPQHYFVNDAQDVELKERFLAILEEKNQSLPPDGALRVFERHDKFGDVIVRDGINYVDYLDVNSEFYSIGQEIDDIYRATGSGLTVVALQKNPKEKLGVGGIYSWKRSQVYITLSEPENNAMKDLWQGELRLVRTRGLVNRKIPAQGKRWFYDIIEGHKFSVENNGE